MTQLGRTNAFEDFNLDDYVEGPAGIINAIRAGEVDAFVVCEPDCDRVYTLGRGDPPYRQMIEEMREGAALLSPDGDILYCNSHLASLIGATADELFTVPFGEWISAEHRALFEECLDQSRSQRTNCEIGILSNRGGTTPVLLTLSPMAVDNVRVICAIVTDLSLQHRTESERAARNEAERSNRLKDEYLATVSHELRNPLNVMLNWATLMRKRELDTETVAQGLEAIERSARTQAKIIDDLLDMNRISSGKIRMEMETFDLADAARAAMTTVEAALEQKKIHARVSAESVLVNGDPDRMQQIISNLLSNAIKFTPEGSRLELSTCQVEGQARLRVVDFGEGIDPAFLPYVFDRFRQGEGALTRRRGGLGLGLAIVKQLVELHGGSVTAQSKGKGKGATFEVVLPVAKSFQVSAAPELLPMGVEVEEDHDLSGVKVLVIDDDGDSVEILNRILTDCGAQVQVASSVEEAKLLMAEGPPDILVSDIGMPDEDGYDLIGHVRVAQRRGNRGVGAIALTALARAEDRDKALAAGYDHYVSKPVEPSFLASLIKALYSKNA